MRKRILSLLCSASIAVSMLPLGVAVAKEKYDVEEATKCLTALGIYDGVAASRDSFVYQLGGFMFDDPRRLGSAEEIAKRIGAIASDEVYTENTGITMLEAYEYAVKVLGYQNQAVSFGGYKKVASDLDLTDGITTNDSAMLTTNDAVRLLFNMLEVAPSVYTGDGVEAANDETLLSLKRNIRKTQGILEADEITSITGGDTAADGCVIINGESFEYNGSVKNYLGKTVVAYAYEEKESDNGEIVYIGEKVGKNNTMTISAEDVERVSDDFSALEYTKDEKTAKVKMPRSINVIYNGKYYGAYTKNDFMPNEGSLKFVDGNGDNTYETVFITSYAAMIVESVNESDKVITGKYNYDDCIKEVVLEEKNRDIDYTIYKGDSKINIAQITANDVLSVAESKSEGDKYVEIYVSENEPVTAQLSGIDPTENLFIYNNEEHKQSRELMIYLVAAGKDLELNREYVFYTDMFGNVVYVKTVLNSNYKVVRKFYSDEAEDIYYATFMDLDEEWRTAKFAKRVKLNGESGPAEVVYDLVKDYKGVIMVIKENSKGEITRIDTAEQDVIKEGVFTKTSEATYTYRSQVYTLGYQYYMEPESYLVLIPDDISDKDGYKVYNARGFFTGDVSYEKISVYDSDEYGFSSMFSIKETQNLNDKRVAKGLFVVENTVKKVVDDEVWSGIEGSAGALQHFTLLGKDDSVFANVKKGDIINVYVNDKGKAESVKVMYNLDNFKKQALSDLYNNGIIAGTIEKLDIAEGRMIINCGTSQRMRISDTIIVSDYEEGKGITDVTKASTLKCGDNIVLRNERGQIKEIIRVK